MVVCVVGAWSSFGACNDPDVCIDGAEQQASCGILGTHSRHCMTGQWSDYGTCSTPESISLQVPGRKDMVHDAQRNLLYITTTGTVGEVRVYNLLTRQFEPSLLTGGSFSGIDLSPDGDQLLVADLLTDANNQASQLPIDAVYSPVADELYLAWYGSNTSIDVYSATTLQKLRDIAPTPGLFSWTGNHAFGNGATVSSHQRFPSCTAWMLLMPRTKGLVSPSRLPSYELNTCTRGPKRSTTRCSSRSRKPSSTSSFSERAMYSSGVSTR
jgi:hypothetical protein